MKEIQKRMLLQICIGFFIGRVDLFGINPAGVAYFAAGYAEGGAKIPVAAGILLGMYTVFAPEKIMGYAMAIAALLLAVDLLQRQQHSYEKMVLCSDHHLCIRAHEGILAVSDAT